MTCAGLRWDLSPDFFCPCPLLWRLFVTQVKAFYLGPIGCLERDHQYRKAAVKPLIFAGLKFSLWVLPWFFFGPFSWCEILCFATVSNLLFSAKYRAQKRRSPCELFPSFFFGPFGWCETALFCHTLATFCVYKGKPSYLIARKNLFFSVLKICWSLLGAWLYILEGGFISFFLVL